MAIEIPEEGPYVAFVGNLPSDVVQGEIEHIFENLKISEVRMMRDKETDAFRGFAFVEFASSDDLKLALEFNAAIYGENVLKVNMADQSRNRRRDNRPKEGREQQHGRGFGAGRGGPRYYEDRPPVDRRYDSDNRRFSNRGPSSRGRTAHQGSRSFQNRHNQFSNGGAGFSHPRHDHEQRDHRQERSPPHEKPYQQRISEEPIEHHGQDIPPAFKSRRPFSHNDNRPRRGFAPRGTGGNYTYDRPDRRSTGGGYQKSDDHPANEESNEQAGALNVEHGQRSGNLFGGRRRARARIVYPTRHGRRNDLSEPLPDTVPSNDPNRPKLNINQSKLSPEEIEAKKARDKEEEEQRRRKLFDIKAYAKDQKSAEAHSIPPQGHGDEAYENSTQTSALDNDSVASHHASENADYGQEATA